MRFSPEHLRICNLVAAIRYVNCAAHGKSRFMKTLWTFKRFIIFRWKVHYVSLSGSLCYVHRVERGKSPLITRWWTTFVSSKVRATLLELHVWLQQVSKFGSDRLLHNAAQQNSCPLTWIRDSQSCTESAHPSHCCITVLRVNFAELRVNCWVFFKLGIATMWSWHGRLEMKVGWKEKFHSISIYQWHSRKSVERVRKTGEPNLALPNVACHRHVDPPPLLHPTYTMFMIVGLRNRQEWAGEHVNCKNYATMQAA